MDDFIFYPTYDLGAFRYAVARYVKLLIRARWKSQPCFLSDHQLAKWHLEDIADDPYSETRLAAMAADALGIVNRDYMPLCGSGGIRETDDSPVGRLIHYLFDFVRPDGGGPFHQGTLVEAVSLLKQGRPVDWKETVNWHLLGVIRDELDLLPDPIDPSTRVRPSDETNTGRSRRDESEFRHHGSDWTISFKGCWPFALQESSGAFYIHYLLRHIGKAIPAVDLAAGWNQFNTASVRHSGSDTDGIIVSPARDDGERIDATGRQAVEKEYERITFELAAAEKNDDLSRVGDLKAERGKLAIALENALKPSGNPVKVGDQHRKLVGRVTRAIRRIIERIATKDSALGAHFEAFVVTGADCRYAPEPTMAWKT
jgi:hypothetical protein